ncbi:type I methionyl aminopeptidase [Rhodothermus marinus]|uniref:type I methionyl aminopeptidase n=1 Tax=Rhodothermus marinus TaxID=29549 RepID=UPI0012BA3800|nr:type I methionyl aminopeptidase [Rhodothermus marinus]BBM72028.1 methionine aminopeptidase [Rhodothermus marinus]
MIHIKTEKEIDILRQCAELVGRTLGEVARYIRPGVTTAELDAIAEDFIRTQGAEPAFKGYRVGRLVYPATLCVSVNDQVVHGIPGDYKLKEGDLVSVDCGVRYRGFYGDSAYTFGVGELDPENVRLCRVTYEALDKGIAQAVAGKRIGDISHAIQRHCEAAGYGVVRALVGHGIGRRLHEEPQVPNVGRPGTGRRLRVGMTLCVEPMVNRGTYEVRVGDDGWTVYTADGQPSAHYEHMVVVRAGRPEVLTTFAYIEEVVEAPYKQTIASPHGETETHYTGR